MASEEKDRARRRLRAMIRGLARADLLPPRFSYAASRVFTKTGTAVWVVHHITPLVLPGDEWKGEAA